MSSPTSITLNVKKSAETSGLRGGVFDSGHRLVFCRADETLRPPPESPPLPISSLYGYDCEGKVRCDKGGNWSV